METKESKEKGLKELSDKDLKEVSGGNSLEAKIECVTYVQEKCDYKGGTFNNKTCKCE